MEDNLYDKDDALDFIIYKESEKEVNNQKNNNGCLTTIFFFLLPCWSLYLLASKL